MQPQNSFNRLAWLLGLGVLCYFVVRSWVNAALIVLGLYCTLLLVIDRAPLRALRTDRRAMWMVLALASPFIAVLAVQVLQQEIVPKYFDGPSRLLVAASIFIVLFQRGVDFARILGYVMPVAVLLCAGLLYLYPGAPAWFWDGRYATYFIDPLTLAQHITIAGFVCLFSVDASGKDAPWQRVLKIAAFLASIAISVGTQSRTGWLMVPVLAALWVVSLRQSRHIGKVGFVAMAAMATAGCAALYLGNDVVNTRIGKAVQEFADYFAGGDRDTSIGVRLSIFHAQWYLFLAKPLTGWGFTALPPLDALPDVAALATPLFKHYFMQGGHNELMQSLMRMGIFGLASRLMLLLIPLVLFAQAARSSVQHVRAAGYLGLVIVIGYGTASLSSEVFNLIYAVSFYGVLVAGLGASALSRERA